jgi:hypothetical protein
MLLNLLNKLYKIVILKILILFINNIIIFYKRKNKSLKNLFNSFKFNKKKILKLGNYKNNSINFDNKKNYY